MTAAAAVAIPVETAVTIPAAEALAAIPAAALTAEATAPAEKDNDIKITNRSSLL